MEKQVTNQANVLLFEYQIQAGNRSNPCKNLLIHLHDVETPNGKRNYNKQITKTIIMVIYKMLLLIRCRKIATPKCKKKYLLSPYDINNNNDNKNNNNNKRNHNELRHLFSIAFKN